MRSLKPLTTAGVRLKPGGAVHEPQDLHPPGHAVEVAELVLQRREYRKCREPGGVVSLLGCQLAADLALHEGARAVHRAVAGDVGEPI